MAHCQLHYIGSCPRILAPEIWPSQEATLLARVVPAENGRGNSPRHNILAVRISLAHLVLNETNPVG